MSGYPVPDAVFEQHSAWLATSGAGKTTAVKGGVERMLARGERVVIVDPTGVWWGLRFLADGRRASPYKPVIFGRHHADLPLEEGSGEAIAHALGTSSTSAILSLKGMRVAERTRFITDFFEVLEGANKGLLNLVIDEIHLFAPQSGGTGLTPAMLHATNNLVSGGRSSGLRIAMISQRPAKVHKDSLTQAKALIALQCSHNLDQRPVRDWLATTVGEKAKRQEIMLSLAGLPTGSGWLSAPQLGILDQVRFPMIATFDSSRAGVEEIPLKPLDVAAMREAMSIFSTSKEEAKRDTIRKGAANEGAKLNMGERPASAAEIAAAEKRGREAGYTEGFTDGRDNGRRVAITSLEGLIATLRAGLADAADCKNSPQNMPEIMQEAPAPAPRRAAASPRIAGQAGALPPVKQKILDALAWLKTTGQSSPARAVVAFIAGASSTSSSYANNLSALRTSGLVDYLGSGLVALTAQGRAQAVTPARLLDHAAMMELLAAKLMPAHMRILRVIAAAYPAPLTRVAIAAEAGASPTSSSFNNNLSRLSSLGLVNYPASGYVRAADLLFPDRAL